MRPDPKRVSGVVALALTTVALLGASVARAENRPLGGAAVNGGNVTILWGKAELHGTNAVGYFVARNTSDKPVQIVAITSTDAASVGWTTKKRVVTLEELFSAGSVCSPDAAVQAATNQQIRELRDLFVPARGTLILRRGEGSLNFSGITTTPHRGNSIDIQLYLAGESVPVGTEIAGTLPAT